MIRSCVSQDELDAGSFVRNDSKDQSDKVKGEKSMRFAFKEFSSLFRTVLKDDCGFGDNNFVAGMVAIVGAMTGRRCGLFQELSLNVAGHETPGAATMGGIKVWLFADKF